MVYGGKRTGAARIGTRVRASRGASRSTTRPGGSTRGIRGREGATVKKLIAAGALVVAAVVLVVLAAAGSGAHPTSPTVHALKPPTRLAHTWGHMHPPASDADPQISDVEAEKIAAAEGMGTPTGYTATLVSYSDSDSPGLQLAPTPRLSWLIEFSGPCMMPNMRTSGCLPNTVFGVVVDATTGEVIVAGGRSADG